jgi:hypothetical protein
MSGGNNIYCLMVAGLSLTDDLRSVMFDRAQVMFREHSTWSKISGPNFEGGISTIFEEATIGSISGFRFQAEIDVGSKTGTVSFLVRPSDLRADDGIWRDLEDSDLVDQLAN